MEPTLVVQQSFRLAGKQLLPGHVIPDEEFDAIPQKNQRALLSQGLVARDDTPQATLSAEEKAAAKALRKARERETAASTRLHELHERRRTLETEIASLREERGQLVAADASDKYETKIKSLRDQIIERTQEMEDVLEGIHAAIERAGKCDRARQEAEREFTLSCTDRLISEHGDLCDRLQQAIEENLVPLVQEYKRQGLAFGRTLGETANRQLHHDWRLRRLLAPILGETVRPRDQIESLRALETQLWTGTAKFARQRAMKETK
jgi:hypothetical protein